MLPRARLRCELLEGRDVPAQFGRPWTDHNLTLSFVPDGTSVDGLTSVLSQSMSVEGLSEPAWKAEILRAAQTWLQNADVNLGVVADLGMAVGAAGAPQGDVRFGDIRISARPLAKEVLAVTIPPGAPGGTRQGDIVLNSDYEFSIGEQPGKYDLYSVMLQEFGHALGVGNSSDTSSPMYEFYQGVRSGITNADIEKLRALYGNRHVDEWDVVNSNGSLGSATTLATPATLASTDNAVVTVDGDLTTSSDADSYKFAVPQGFSGAVSIRLRVADQSVLVGRVSLYQSDYVLRASAASKGPSASDPEIRLNDAGPEQVYYIRIDQGDSYGGAFAVGHYQLQIEFNPAAPPSAGAVTSVYVDDAHTNDERASATVLTDNSRAGLFAIDARFRNNADLDIYKIHTGVANSSTNAPRPMTVSIRSVDPASGLKPLVVVTDNLQNVIPYEVVQNANGEYVIQVAEVLADRDYYIAASADSFAANRVGDYRLEANLRAAATQFNTFAAGQLTNQDRITYSTLTVRRASAMHFVLNVSGSDANFTAGARLTLFNAAGHVVVDNYARNNRSISVTKILTPGEYTLRVTGMPRFANSELPTLTYTLRGMNLSDPIGPQGSDPDSPSIYDFDWIEHDDAYYSLNSYDDLPDIIS